MYTKVVTLMSGSGQVYVTYLLSFEGKFPWEYSAKPGTLEAVGRWSYFYEMSERHNLTQCICKDPPVLHDPTFLCPHCNRRVGQCLESEGRGSMVCRDCVALQEVLESILAKP